MSSDQTAVIDASPSPVTPLQHSTATRALIDITAGTIGGIGLVLVGYPFDTVKVRLQTQSFTNPLYKNAVDCVRTIYRQEGIVNGFLKGIQSPLYGQMVFNAAQFMIYSEAKDTVLRTSGQPTTDTLTVPQYFVAGALVGAAVSVIESPIDLFKTQLQTQIYMPADKRKFSTFGTCVSYISRTYGIRGVYQGFVSTVIRNIPSVGMYFGAFEWSKQRIAAYTHKSTAELSPLQLLTAGWAGGIGYWLFTYPVDVVKSTLQSEPPNMAERKHRHWLPTAKFLYSQGGIGRFFNGYVVCLLRAGPANAVCFMLYETTAKYLNTAVPK